MKDFAIFFILGATFVSALIFFVTSLIAKKPSVKRDMGMFFCLAVVSLVFMVYVIAAL